MALEGERRDDLVRTAAHEFASRGFEQASLNAVIMRCRMSKSSFYHAIDSKLALYELVIADTAARLADALALPQPESFAGEDFWERVQGLVERVTQVLTGDSVYADLGRMMYDREAPSESAEAARVLASAEQWIHAVVRIGRGCGAIRTDLPVSLQGELAFTALRTLDRWSVRHHDEIPAEDVDGLAGAQTAAIRRLLAPG